MQHFQEDIISFSFMWKSGSGHDAIFKEESIEILKIFVLMIT